MNIKTHIIQLIAVVLLFQACKKEEEKLDADLVISPSSIFITEKTGKFYLSVQPGHNVDWEISKKPSWMEIAPSKGRINNNIIELSYTIHDVDLDEGSYHEPITIKSDRVRSATATAKMTISALPIAEFSPSQLNLSDEVAETEFLLKNTGNITLSFELEPDKDWVALSRYQGYLSPGDSIKIMLTVNRASLPVGTEQAQIKAKINSTVEGAVLSISMAVPPHAQLEASAPEIHFSYLQDQKSMYLINRGNVSTNWNLQFEDSYINANHISGILQANDSINLQFTINREFLLSQRYNSGMRFSANHGQEVSVPVSIDNYVEEKWLIEGIVIEAVYDRNYNYVYMLFDDLPEVKRLDPLTKEIVSIPIIRQPNAIAIGQNGNYAVVAHSTSVSYVNLMDLSVESIYHMNFVVGSVLLANGWIYIFPHSGNANKRVKCLEIASGEITDHTGASQSPGLRAKLHPSKDYFYCTNHSTSYSSLLKFDISNGTAQHQNVNPSGYDAGSKLWVADDGSRIITRSRNIFRITDDPATDLSYNGELSAIVALSAFDYSSAAGISLAGMLMHPTYSGPCNFVRKYSNAFLTEIEDINLPKFLYPTADGTGGLFEPECHYIFFNSEGSKAFVVVKSRAGTGSLHEWAIVTIDIY
jgi:hypothetical protein